MMRRAHDIRTIKRGNLSCPAFGRDGQVENSDRRLNL
jgi:hypothetical protein